MAKKNLIQARKNERYTQQAVASAAGISVRQYRNLESGESNGSIEVWKKLAAFFKLPMEYLIEEDEANE